MIEQLHALGHEPIAGLSFTLRTDFEGDQWTFFKFPHSDLIELFGIDIQELVVWKPIVTHIEELVLANKIPLVELDSYFLPDTAGTSYKRIHVKSSVAINFIDLKEHKLGYFHNSGYYELEGQDFKDIFQLDGLVHARMLPPYFEYMKRDREFFLPHNQLLSVSLSILKKNCALIPIKNPFIVFKDRFQKDFEWLINSEIEVFHTYSFANLRQFGANFELAEIYFKWLGSKLNEDLSVIIDPFKNISDMTKTYQFQLARAMARKKTLDVSPLVSMSEYWETAVEAIKVRFL